MTPGSEAKQKSTICRDIQQEDCPVICLFPSCPRAASCWVSGLVKSPVDELPRTYLAVHGLVVNLLFTGHVGMELDGTSDLAPEKTAVPCICKRKQKKRGCQTVPSTARPSTTSAKQMYRRYTTPLSCVHKIGGSPPVDFLPSLS